MDFADFGDNSRELATGKCSEQTVVILKEDDDVGSLVA